MILRSPLAGWSSSLDETPDPVFATRMLGDGLAIDPTANVLHAPCDAEIVSVPASRHAVTLRAGGVEILMHIGIDTVGLGGEGFEALVAERARVRTGDPLLRFDLDLLARRAKSLLTPVIVTDGARYRIVRRHQDALVGVGDFLLELEAVQAASAGDSPADGSTSGRRAPVGFEHGIHARPAALIAACAKGFTASASLELHGRTANARSVVALMSLGAQHGDGVAIRAAGADADAALAALEALIVRGDRDAAMHRATAPAAALRSPTPAAAPPAPGALRGIVACRGLAIGRAALVRRPEVQVEETGTGTAHETAALERAREGVAARLRALADSTLAAQRELMLAHLEFLDDPELVFAARASIAAGKSAGFAWRQAVRAHVNALEALGDPRMAERVDDLRDLETSVLLALEGSSHDASTSSVPEGSVLLARDLLPSQLAALDAAKVGGICLAEGGPTSHVAILAAAMGVPTLVAAGAGVLGIAAGT
ncbi:MAG TPA: glucose PTS transporter subunit IIA, partial [Steroidobacteraceae bacterium]|nr:glucose PTS transporter subunit IIA [Steroidobacteraceae bacterium]